MENVKFLKAFVLLPGQNFLLQSWTFLKISKNVNISNDKKKGVMSCIKNVVRSQLKQPNHLL